MQSTLVTHERPANAAEGMIIERFLRDPDGIWQQIKLEHSLGGLIRRMLFSSAVALALYGGVMGIGHSPLQALAAAIKLPVLYLLTLAICLPTLYLFNLLVGGKLSVQQALALVLSAITVSSSLALAFVPIVLFFMITAYGYHFYSLLNISILALTGGIGLTFLLDGMQHINRQVKLERAADEQQGEAVRAPAHIQSVNVGLLRIWLLLYAFVGTQLSWTLRPIVGDPDQPFMLFRPIEGNFYAGIIEIITKLLAQ